MVFNMRMYLILTVFSLPLPLQLSAEYQSDFLFRFPLRSEPVGECGLLTVVSLHWSCDTHAVVTLQSPAEGLFSLVVMQMQTLSIIIESSQRLHL